MSSHSPNLEILLVVEIKSDIMDEVARVPVLALRWHNDREVLLASAPSPPTISMNDPMGEGWGGLWQPRLFAPGDAPLREGLAFLTNVNDQMCLRDDIFVPKDKGILL